MLRTILQFGLDFCHAVLEKKVNENDKHKHEYSTGTEEDKPNLDPNF